MSNEPWQQLSNETAKAYAAFQIYLQFGPSDRSQAKVARKLGHRGTTQCTKWSSKYNWVERVNAFDAQNHADTVEAYKDALQERQAAVMENVWQQYEWLTNHIKRIMLSETKPTRETLHKMVALQRDADTLVRRAVSLPDRITENAFDLTTDGESLNTIAIVNMNVEDV